MVRKWVFPKIRSPNMYPNSRALIIRTSKKGSPLSRNIYIFKALHQTSGQIAMGCRYCILRTISQTTGESKKANPQRWILLWCSTENLKVVLLLDPPRASSIPGPPKCPKSWPLAQNEGHKSHCFEGPGTCT